MTYRSIAVLLCAVALASCEKNGVQEITGSFPGASVKFYNFGVNTPDVNFYANDTKMTAISSADSTEKTTGTAYGSVGAGGNYAAIEPGQYTLSGKITADVDKGLAISSTSTTLEDGKFYSYYQSGFYDDANKTVDAFIVEDPLPDFDYSVAYVRFVNAISNSSPMTLYAKNTTTGQEGAVGAEVAYEAAGAFTPVTPGAYDLGARNTGTGTDAISRAGVSFSAGHVYTISARGDMTVTSSTDAKRPMLDNTANR